LQLAEPTTFCETRVHKRQSAGLQAIPHGSTAKTSIGIGNSSRKQQASTV
jgi:hypothetical protein